MLFKVMIFHFGQAKSKELAGHYSALQGDLDAAEGKLDEMAQLNRTLVREAKTWTRSSVRSHKMP